MTRSRGVRVAPIGVVYGLVDPVTGKRLGRPGVWVDGVGTGGRVEGIVDGPDGPSNKNVMQAQKRRTDRRLAATAAARAKAK